MLKQIVSQQYDRPHKCKQTHRGQNKMIKQNAKANCSQQYASENNTNEQEGRTESKSEWLVGTFKHSKEIRTEP